MLVWLWKKQLCLFQWRRCLFLEPTITEQWAKSFLLKKTMEPLTGFGIDSIEWLQVRCANHCTKPYLMIICFRYIEIKVPYVMILYKKLLMKCVLYFQSLAHDIILTLGESFEVAFQMAMKDKSMEEAMELDRKTSQSDVEDSCSITSKVSTNTV